MTGVGGIAALAAAVTFVFGIVLAVTTLTDYTEGLDPAEAVQFVVGHQTTLFVWYLVVFLVFGVALVPLVRALRGVLRERAGAGGHRCGLRLRVGRSDVRLGDDRQHRHPGRGGRR